MKLTIGKLAILLLVQVITDVEQFSYAGAVPAARAGQTTNPGAAEVQEGLREAEAGGTTSGL